MTDTHITPSSAGAREERLAGWAIAALLAAIFFTASMTPSMMPRSALVQGFVGGVAAAVGFQIGYFVRWLWRFLELPTIRGPWSARLRLVAFALAGLLLIYGLWQGAAWQNATRAAVSLPPLESYQPLTILLVAAGVFVVVWAIFQALGHALRVLNRLLMKLLPPRVSIAIGFVLVAWLTWALVEGVLATSVLRGIDESFRIADSFVDPEIAPPESPLKTGSDASLVDWAEMGQWGRAYVAEAPTSEEISEFTGEAAVEPLRVYVGLRSAGTPRERAELALEELIRVGGFDRSVVLLVISTGTGWMDPGAQDTIEYMLGGDVATVVAQYSYLPSAISLVANAQVGIDQARELFDVVYGYWTALPKQTRPKLYVHGLSLGAFNLQVAMPLMDLLGDPINGAMWAGSPFFSPVWNRVKNGREDDSPVWQPVFGNGSLVRVLTQNGLAEDEAAPWGPMRLVFLNYGSDPIAAFAFESGWRSPAWMGEPRAHDLTPELRWFPLVTMLQVAVDTAFSLAVPAYGHYYVAPHYIDAWAELLDPPGWTPEREERLKAIFAARPPPLG